MYRSTPIFKLPLRLLWWKFGAIECDALHRVPFDKSLVIVKVVNFKSLLRFLYFFISRLTCFRALYNYPIQVITVFKSYYNVYYYINL